MNTIKLGCGQPLPHGTWDYESSERSAVGGFRQCATHTVKIFQWVKKNQRKQTKRAVTIFRFKGQAGQTAAVEAALACCEELNRGISPEEMFDHGIFEGKKSIALRPGDRIQHIYNGDEYLYTALARYSD